MSLPIELAKKAVRMLPQLDRVFVERDLLRIETADLKTTASRLAAEAAALREERAALLQERERLRDECQTLASDMARVVNTQAPQFVPPGHFYSPVPPLDELERNAEKIFAARYRDLPGVELREPEQLALLGELRRYYDPALFPVEKREDRRYFYANHSFSYSDGFFLHAMLRHLAPRRIIEVGSGFSSCMTLDTNELFFGNAMDCTFIEPYPDLLLSLLRPGDRERVQILQQGLQSVPLERFAALESGDVLFIDSTHVCRVGSDVNYLFFEILPSLRAGVYVHIHDVFAGFEYPREWIYQGRQWTEQYLLRAFLQYNQAFRVVLFNTFLEAVHEEEFVRHLPLCLKNRGGSIWLQKTA